MAKRKVGNLTALGLLALLVSGTPMHPYEMATLLRRTGKGQDMRIKWGSLYTVVGNLDKHGLIEAVDTGREGRRPERTRYAITDAGRAELHDWMRELVAEPAVEQPRFGAALSVLGVLPPDEAADLLELRLVALRADADARRADLRRHAAEVPRLFLIEDEYALAVREAEVSWVRSLVTELRDGTLPGLDSWRTWHDSGGTPPEWTALIEGVTEGEDRP
jgi:DNA-binding PadR family transcriptional regulator